VRLFLLGLACALLAQAQDFTHLDLQKIAKDLHYAKGPAWSTEGFLLFSDTVVDKLWKFTPGVGGAEFASRAGGAMGNAFDAEGRLYTCEFRQRRVTRTLKNGKIEVLASRFDGKRLNAPDGITVRRDGHVYFTDPAFGSQQDARELDFYGVYHITPRGELLDVAKWSTRPTGIALSPNGRILYVADADQRLVRAYDLDGRGFTARERVVIDNIDGPPLGLAVDEKGNVYAAARNVYAYSVPQNGPAKLIGSIPMQEPPADLAFGDPDGETLYIAARTSVYRIRLGVKGALQY
jgi:sugar lactone lactonase YvrE